MADKIITAQDMMYLTSRGVQAWRTLAASIGKTVTETRRLVEQGALDKNPIAVSVFQEMMAQVEP